jgi:hypothetical protein
MIILRRSAVIAVLMLAAFSSTSVQSSNNGPPSPQSSSAAQDKRTKSDDQKRDEQRQTNEQEKAIQKKEQSQRLLGAIPNFATTSRRSPPPLTPAEKFHLFVKSSFDPVEFGVVGMQSAISQGEDEFPEYGQGVSGFGKRYGATFADEVSSSFFTDYFYPVLFKEDPRYFRLGEGSIRHRLVYALKQEVICHTDHGGRSVSWENAFGALTAGAVSNAYYPPSERGLGLTMSRSAISAGYGSLGGVVNEFYPDISRRLFHRHESISSERQLKN